MSIPANLPFSPIRIVDGIAYLSGEVPFEADGSFASSITQQTDTMLGRVKARLEEHGIRMRDVISCTVYLTDKAYFAEFNQAYARWFTAPLPVRTTVCAGMMVDDAAMEITVIARVPA
ncbi:RidA family protein [Rouxiella chamberiensis]|uniref:RidA family protein n=1 Tax=Rouxiella chamberiensis TaxID=1513468 RepID=A0ABY7HNV7_9GAMM|nr:RidA family protein [Rouxiella chamberiensis]WAT00717.1 RidA family protein [Rouxiella chamberiensis]